MTDFLPGTEQLSDVDKALMIEEYGGEVETQFAKASIMHQLINVRTLRNTDTLVNNRMGRTKLQALVPGVSPPSNPTNFGRVSLTVDTVILARDTRSMLNEFQTNFDARMELGQDHGKEIGKFFDTAFIIQAIKGSTAPAPTGANGASLNGSIGAGKNVTLAAAGDEEDPDKLVAGIQQVVTAFENEEIDVENMVALVSPATFKVLKDNNKLLSRDFAAGNGDYAKGLIYEVEGIRIIKTARIPNQAITGHYLSNADNGNAYDLTATQANAVVVFLHPKSLLAAETIPMTSDIFFDQKEKVWYIDTFISFGVTINRPDCCGAVFKHA